MASDEFAEPHRHSARGCTSSSVLVASNGAQAMITMRQQLDPIMRRRRQIQKAFTRSKGERTALRGGSGGKRLRFISTDTPTPRGIIAQCLPTVDRQGTSMAGWQICIADVLRGNASAKHGELMFQVTSAGSWAVVQCWPPARGKATAHSRIATSDGHSTAVS
jgi:hypothetical protein